MRTNMVKGLAALFLLVVIVIVGCTINSSTCRNYDHHAEKQCSAESTVIPGGELFTDLTYTDITVIGQDTSGCTVEAELTVSATSQEIADHVAGQLRVELIQETDRLAIVVQKPVEHQDDYHVGGKMKISVPTQTRLNLATTYGDCQFDNIEKAVSIRSTYGDLDFENIRGDIAAVTKYGGIRAENIQAESIGLTTKYGRIALKDTTAPKIKCLTSYKPIGLDTVTADSLELQTKYGPIELNQCTAKKATLNTSYSAVRGEIAGLDEVAVETKYGPIDLKCVNAANPEIVADLRTKYSHITFCPPAGFAGRVSASTSYGKIRTDQPVLMQGVIGDHLNGTIGDGTGSITMINKYGNITLKQENKNGR